MSEEIAQLKALLEREQQENKWIRDANNALAEKNKKLIEAFKLILSDNWCIDLDVHSIARKALEENEK